METVRSKRKAVEELDGEMDTKCKRKEPSYSVTTVSNVKVSHIRPKYKHLKDWTEDDANLYIGRAGVVFVHGERFPKKQSIWANPFKVGRDGSIQSVLKKFEDFIKEKLRTESHLYSLDDLRGRNLGCWCVPHQVGKESVHDQHSALVCHGQILLKLLEETTE